ncbi:hypothetical protein [Flagellimonas onchidii]|uniref:hypothetical protein n=1 Tax=Flagellimonas onchidii TaxID=2562684 RepID=UPI0010A5C7F7|nr:hypothetical protein [Allomuricauda onchidii]
MKRILYIFLFVGFLSCGQETIVLNELKAFPTAIGGGKDATGGRGGDVYFVTNLNNSGSGSLREGLASGNRTIIFRVGGTIELTSNITVNSSNITVAGETAPGDGIALHGGGFYLMGENYIIRHMRFRGGDGLASDNDTFRVQSQSNVGTWENYIIDHCSISWSKDENLAIETGRDGDVSVSGFTVQNSIISEGFNGKNMILWGRNITNVSVMQNYFANTAERSIESTVAQNVIFEMENNVVYGYSAAMRMVVQNRGDVVGNLFYDGWANQFLESIRMEDCNSGNCPPSGITSATGTLLYNDDNIYNGGAATVHTRFNSYLSGSHILDNGYTLLSSAQVESVVMSNVGARVGISGVDALDQHMLDDYDNGNTGGFVSNESQTTGLPTLSSGTPDTDTDNDGLYDWFESAHATDRNAISTQFTFTKKVGGTAYYVSNVGGYTNLEVQNQLIASDFDYLLVKGNDPGDSSYTITNEGVLPVTKKREEILTID